jgi:hypothetical protein
MDLFRHRCFKLIDQFNRDWNLDIKISEIHYWQKECEAQYIGWQTYGHLKINPKEDFEIVKQHIYHELGHALIDQYFIKRKFLDVFIQNSPVNNRNRIYKIMENVEEPPPWNFVSWYATVNGTEDFCETLSAWVYNDYKTKGKIYFDGWESSLNQEKLLNKKIKQVEKLLKAA